MASKPYPPVNPACPHLLHGGDYNPDQWLHMPEILDEDMRLMELAGCNAMSVGIFAWAALEPREGEYCFDWLDDVLDRLAKRNAFAVLATPSGSKPAWMSKAYPEVCRMNADGIRQPHGGRHNHCRTSPVYREQCVAINTRLAERYRDHPALLLWHVSNEYNGDPCFCPHCLAAWRDWLRARYDNDLDRLNRAWWTGFWAHTFSDWDEILPVDHSIHGMMLDWKRFNSEQTVDFFRVESAPLRSITPAVPITTNFMGFFESLDYFAFAEALDVASWDSYPRWHDTGDDVAIAREAALAHDLVRGLKNGQPFLLMESVPSTPTRQDVRMRKRPGMHLLSSLQAVAHGSDSVQYFQWRKGRGGIEKFHGAVVDHVGHEHTRVFREVADVGAALGKLDAIVGTEVPAEVALVYDWENRWAVHNAIGLGEHVHYIPTCQAHYRPFWERGVPVDVVDQTRSLDGYKLVVAPMLYLLRPGMAERLRAFVEGGGTLVGTYWTGIVDQHDLCHLGGWPGAGLRKLFGVWDEELDVLAAGRQNTVRLLADNALGLEGAFTARELCTLIHAEGAEVLAEYGDDFYAGRPALTAHRVGDGTAYYVASRNEHAFQATFADRLVDLLGIATPLPAVPPPGASVQVRRDAENEYLFLMNFTTEPVTLALGPAACTDLLEGGEVAGEATLAPYGVRVLQRART